MARRANRTLPLRDGIFTSGRLRDILNEPAHGARKCNANDGRMHSAWLSEPVDRGSYEDVLNPDAEFNKRPQSQWAPKARTMPPQLRRTKSHWADSAQQQPATHNAASKTDGFAARLSPEIPSLGMPPLPGMAASTPTLLTEMQANFGVMASSHPMGGLKKDEPRDLQSLWLTSNAAAAAAAPDYRQQNMTYEPDIMEIKWLRNKQILTAGHQHGNRSQARGINFVSRQSNWGTNHLPQVRSESTPIPATKLGSDRGHAPRIKQHGEPSTNLLRMSRGDSSGVGGCCTVGYNNMKVPTREVVHLSKRKRLPNEMTGWTSFMFPMDHHSRGAVPFDRVKAEDGGRRQR